MIRVHLDIRKLERINMNITYFTDMFVKAKEETIGLDSNSSTESSLDIFSSTGCLLIVFLSALCFLLATVDGLFKEVEVFDEPLFLFSSQERNTKKRSKVNKVFILKKSKKKYLDK